jgi:hypothetical protein
MPWRPRTEDGLVVEQLLEHDPPGVVRRRTISALPGGFDCFLLPGAVLDGVAFEGLRPGGLLLGDPGRTALHQCDLRGLSATAASTRASLGPGSRWTAVP